MHHHVAALSISGTSRQAVSGVLDFFVAFAGGGDEDFTPYATQASACGASEYRAAAAAAALCPPPPSTLWASLCPGSRAAAGASSTARPGSTEAVLLSPPHTCCRSASHLWTRCAAYAPPEDGQSCRIAALCASSCRLRASTASWTRRLRQQAAAQQVLRPQRVQRPHPQPIAANKRRATTHTHNIF